MPEMLELVLAPRGSPGPAAPGVGWTDLVCLGSSRGRFVELPTEVEGPAGEAVDGQPSPCGPAIVAVVVSWLSQSASPCSGWVGAPAGPAA